MKHLVNPVTNEWYHLDENNLVYTCPCRNSVEDQVSICISITKELEMEGTIRELEREIAQKRKELGFLSTETLEEGFVRLLADK